MKLWLGAAAALSLLALAAGGAGVAHKLSPLDAQAAEQLFVVERGASLGRIAQDLERARLVRDARAVRWLAHYRGQAEQLRAGEYRLSAAMAPGAILDDLAAGRVATHAVVIPEGFTAAQIGERLAAAGLVDRDAFAAAVDDPGLAAELGVPAPGLEGYLFPDTYEMARGLGAREVARVLVERFQRAWAEVAPAARARGLSMHVVVTLASIVEKETGAPEERPLIASVFSNRVERGMRLESDPTVIYGIPDFDGNLRRVHLEDEGNPYNTYRIAGLPPGPIASPGLEALRAVVQPAESDYLYFVSRNDGTHVFSRSYREHVRNVDRFQRRGR